MISMAPFVRFADSPNRLFSHRYPTTCGSATAAAAAADSGQCDCFVFVMTTGRWSINRFCERYRAASVSPTAATDKHHAGMQLVTENVSTKQRRQAVASSSAEPLVANLPNGCINSSASWQIFYFDLKYGR
jgi:hypothetical protein